MDKFYGIFWWSLVAICCAALAHACFVGYWFAWRLTAMTLFPDATGWLAQPERWAFVSICWVVTLVAVVKPFLASQEPRQRPE